MGTDDSFQETINYLKPFAFPTEFQLEMFQMATDDSFQEAINHLKPFAFPTGIQIGNISDGHR